MRSCFDRMEKANVFMLYLMECCIAAVGVVFIYQFSGGNILWASGAAVVFITTVFSMVPLVSDHTAKDIYTPPYIRCEGCGNLRSKEDSSEWNGHVICSSCSRDKEHRIEYAVKQPMYLKRLSKN